MCDIVEVLFASDVEDNQVSLAAWDLRTGTNLMNYKGGGCVQAHSLCLLGAGEYILTANSMKPLLHIWPINGQEQITSARFVVPGRVNVMALSPDGIFLIAGIQETIYIWHFKSGRMLNTISKHYQPISCLRFTDDSSYFVSGGADGGILVWNLSLAVTQLAENNHVPVYSFADHGLPVTDIHIGGGGVRSFMYSVSLDRSCKIYDLSSGQLLLSVVFTENLLSVTVNKLESSIYVGTNTGVIHEFHIDPVPRVKEYHMEPEKAVKFFGHAEGSQITCLALSLDGQTLVSGGQDSKVCIWHIGSHQLLKTLLLKGAVSDLKLRLTNPAIFNAAHKQPHRFADNLHRMIDSPEAYNEQTIETQIIDSIRIPKHKTKRDRRNTAPSEINTRLYIDSDAAIDKDVHRLRNEIQKLKNINKQIFIRATSIMLEREMANNE